LPNCNAATAGVAVSGAVGKLGSWLLDSAGVPIEALRKFDDSLTILTI
jgi:hypothetical protein